MFLIAVTSQAALDPFFSSQIPSAAAFPGLVILGAVHDAFSAFGMFPAVSLRSALAGVKREQLLPQ